ncbi:MAG: class I SAM-dependent methyltransferase [Halioglobus sp.]|nr:class I SAM-dependent methyltransferase [Halioglobus sp.]
MTLERRELVLIAATAADEKTAAALACRLNLRQLSTGVDPVSCNEARAILVARNGALFIQQTGKRAPGPIAVDFTAGALHYRRHDSTAELLGKAVGQRINRPLRIVDATAGLGTDAFILAYLGHEVVLCERNPVLVELLRSGLQVASSSGDGLLVEILGRMTLVAGDVRDCDRAVWRDVDVIYLDPMFPRRAKGAAVKKEMALLQWLLEDASLDAERLLHWALECRPARVVVKRPPRAASLASRAPSHQLKAKAVRYDVYVQRKLQ